VTDVWVAVLGSGGTVDTVRVFYDHEKAMSAITEHLEGSGYTAESWLKKIAETYESPVEDLYPTYLYAATIEK
jgi:hypothetical protein